MATSVNLICSLCDDEGIQNPAVHWCTDCCSFLCYQCSRHHQRNRASKHHHTIAAENYEELPDFIKATTNQCQKHDKRIEMYCNSHESPCCIQCLADDHKTCPDLKSIEDVLSTVKSSASSSNLHDKLTILQQNYNKILEHLEKERMSVNQQTKDKLQEIINIRQKLNVHLDKLEKQLNDEIELKAQSVIVELESTSSRVESKLKIIEMNIKDHGAMLKCATDLQTFIGLGVMNKRIKSEKECLDNIKDGKELNKSKFEIKFSPTLSLILCLDSLGEILHSYSKGVLEIKPVESDHSVVPIQSSISDIRPTLLNTFTVSEEGKETFITGCDLQPNGDFVIADQLQTFVKYYNDQGVMTSKIYTENGCPFDVCFIDDNTCAVSTVRESSNHAHVLFVDIKTNRVSKKVFIGIGKKYIFFDKRLFVSTVDTRNIDKGEFICINTDNQILNRFSKNEVRGIFFSKHMIYYNEYNESAVVCSYESGNIKWRYQDPSIKGPCNIVVDDRGFVFVTCCISYTVVIISKDGKAGSVVLSKDDGLNVPFALAIDQNGRKLMVCNKEDEKVFLYQL